MASPPQRDDQQTPAARGARDFTLLLANATKVAGLVVGVLEARSAHPDTGTLIFAGFLIMGVQAVEDLVLKTIERFLGR